MPFWQPSAAATISSAQFSTSDTKSDTVNTEQSFATTYPIASGYLVANKGLEVLMGFQLVNTATAPTSLIKVKLGATVVYSTYAQAVSVNGPTTQGFGIHIIIQGTAAAGASVNVVTNLIGNYAGGSAFGFTQTVQPVAVATNTALTLQPTITFGTVGTGLNTLTLNQLIVKGTG